MVNDSKGWARMDSLRAEKYKRFLLGFAFVGAVVAILFVTARYLFPVLLPFIIAFIFASILKPIIMFLNGKLRFNRRVAAVLVVALFYIIVFAVISFVGVKIFIAIKGFVVKMPEIYQDSISPFLTRVFEVVDRFFMEANPDGVGAMDELASGITGSLGALVSDMSKTLLNYITALAASIPELLLKLLILVISTFYMALDYRAISNFIMRQFSDRTRVLITDIRMTLSKTVGKYIRSYALILVITFVELSIGLLIVGIDNAVLVAAGIAIVDIFPVVGSGTILIPWTIICLATGKIGRGIGLGVVYIIVTVIRNIIEPRIVGQNIGVHPLVMLICIILGIYLFGGMGLFIMPLGAAIIKSLNDRGKIHLYK